MTKPPYVVLKNDSPDPIPWEEWDEMVFKILKESLRNSPALGQPEGQIPFFLFVYEKGMLLGCSP